MKDTNQIEQIRKQVIARVQPRPGSATDAALVDRMVELIIREAV